MKISPEKKTLADDIKANTLADNIGTKQVQQTVMSLDRSAAKLCRILISTRLERVKTTCEEKLYLYVRCGLNMLTILLFIRIIILNLYLDAVQ